MRQGPDILQAIIMRLKDKANWRSLVITLSAIVVFVTTYLLILPAITLDKDEAIQQGGIDVAVEQTVEVEDTDAPEADDAADVSDETVMKEGLASERAMQGGSAQAGKTTPDTGEVKLLNTTKELSADVDESAGFSVSAVVDKADKVPADVSLQATELTKDTKGFDYDEYYNKALKALKKDDSSVENIKMIRFYDISLESDTQDESVEPSDTVSVKIAYEKGIKVSDAGNIRIVHFGEDKTEVLSEEDNKVETTINDNSCLSETAFETDGFSEYAVVEVETIEETVIASDGHNYKISVTYGKDAGVPKGAKLEVTEILQSEEAADEATEYETYLEKTREALGMESGVFGYARFFDIRIVDENGKKVRMAAPVDVKIELADKEGGDESESRMQVVHFPDGAEKGDVVRSTAGDTKKGQVVAFEAEGFSVYAIVEGPSATPQNWERLETVQDVIEQGKEGENRTGGLYVGHTGGYYFMNSTVSDSNGRIGIKKTKPAKVTPPTDEACKYYFEQVDGTSNQVYAYCYSAAGQKQYVYNGGNNSLSFTTEANKTAFTINVDSEGRFTLQNGNWYWNMQSGQSGSRFCSYTANDDNSKFYFWKLKEDTGGDPYGLDEVSYTLLTWDGGKTGKALTGDMNADHAGNLCAEFLTVMTNKDDNSLQVFVPNNSSEQVTPWTFHWQHDDCYKLSAVIYTRDSEGKQIEAGTKYLKIDGNGLQMVDSADDASEIQVVPGTGIHAGQIMLKSGNSTLTYSGKFEEGFNINSGAGKEYLYLAEGEPEDELKDYYRTYTADKISVSSEELTPDPPTAEYPDGVPKKVIIYTRVWNGSGYRYFAIDGNGAMVPCFDSGNEIEWIGSSLDELQWELTEYGTWEGDTLTPNYYYELQNTYSKKYLAPLISSDQVLSDNKIGLNLNGRRNGQYYTPVLAWDGSNYSFASIKADLDAAGDAKIEPCYRVDGMDIYFAIINELDKDDTLHTVPTVDNDMYGITMKMANYTKYLKGDGCDTSKEQTDVLGDKKYDKNGPTQGLLSTNLGENGYPTAIRTGESLSKLYKDAETPAEEVNHLFVESTYKATGYYEYDSAQNYASLNGATSGDFTVYQEIGTHDSSDKWTLKHGQFLPYNDLVPGHFASTNGRNTYTPTGPLDQDDPRYNEQLYLVDDPEFTFGLELTAGFYQTPSGLDAWGHDIIFEFSGDDDFWLYVDGELVIDLGGIHSAYPGSVNFRTGDVNVNGVSKTLKQVFIENYLARGMTQSEAEAAANEKFITKYDEDLGREVTTFKDNTKHEMRIFYMERGWGASNLHMKFNLAAVEQGTMQLSKELDVNNVDMSDQVFATFPYQIWYKNPINNEYEQLTEQTLGNHGSVKYLGSTRDVTYKEEIYVDNTYKDDNDQEVKCSVKYEGVYLVDPGETIVIKFPIFGETGSEQYVTEYKVVECGVDPNVYPDVTLDDGTVIDPTRVYTNIRVDERDEHGDPATITPIPEVYSGLCNYEIGYDTLDNRSKVRYKNNVEKTEELLIQKNLYKKEGTEEPQLIPKSELYDEDGLPLDPYDSDLKTTYDFRAYFKTPYDADYSPANVYEYHVKDPGGYYCKWVPADPEHTDPNDPLSVGHFERILVDGAGIKDYEDLVQLDSDTLHHATFDTSINGSISQIPAYYDVELRGLIPGTQFKVVERPNETPEGFEFYRYEVNDDGTNLIVYPDDPWEGVTGSITKEYDSQVLVDNYKGFALHLYKTWADASTIQDRDPAYFAVFYEVTNPDTGEISRTLVSTDDAVRQLSYESKPQELAWFYLHLPDVDDVEFPEFGKYVVREVTLTGDSITVGDDGVVSGYDSYTVVEEGGVVELNGTANSTGAEEKQIPYKVTYAEPKTVGTNLREFRVTDTPSDKPAVKFLKEDWSKHPLAGATFTLKQGTTDIFPAEGKTSDSQGLISIDHLTDNTDYVLKEIATPPGYYGLQDPLTLQLVTDEATGWTLDVSPDSGEITNFYEVGFEQEKNDQGIVIAEYVTLTLKNKPYHFEAIKVDGSNDKPLSGVKFELYEWKTVGSTGDWSGPVKWDGISVLETDNNGVIPHLDEDLSAGTYQLREVASPDCYKTVGNIDFTISNTGVISLGASPPAGVVLSGPTEGTGKHEGEYVYTLTVPNTPQPLKLKKVDGSGQDLTGAKFTLQKHNGSTWENYNLPGTQSNEINMTSAAVFDIENLPDGFYHLTETNAPPDYVITEDSIYFKIIVEYDANGKSKRTVALTDESGTGQPSNPNATLTEPVDGVYTIVIKNIQGEPLPMTGGIGTIIFYVIGSILVLGCGIVLAARRRVRAHK